MAGSFVKVNIGRVIYAERALERQLQGMLRDGIC